VAAHTHQRRSGDLTQAGPQVDLAELACQRSDSAVDDRSRVAFSQILNDKTGTTAARFLVEAAGFLPTMACGSSGC
jgi:hypothetical protein